MRKAERKTIIIITLVAILVICFVFATCLVIQRVSYPKKYQEYVERYAKEFGVPEYVVYSVIKVESNFDKFAVSKKGACGLMQLMPKTYNWLVEELGQTPKDIFSEDENIKYGVYYLSVLYKKYGSWSLTFCAYNAGTGNVDKWLLEKPFRIRFFETQRYVNKLEVVMGKYKSLYYK